MTILHDKRNYKHRSKYVYFTSHIVTKNGVTINCFQINTMVVKISSNNCIAVKMLFLTRDIKYVDI